MEYRRTFTLSKKHDQSHWIFSRLNPLALPTWKHSWLNCIRCSKRNRFNLTEVNRIEKRLSVAYLHLQVKDDIDVFSSFKYKTYRQILQTTFIELARRTTTEARRTCKLICVRCRTYLDRFSGGHQKKTCDGSLHKREKSVMQ